MKCNYVEEEILIIKIGSKQEETQRDGTNSMRRKEERLERELKYNKLKREREDNKRTGERERCTIVEIASYFCLKVKKRE